MINAALRARLGFAIVANAMHPAGLGVRSAGFGVRSMRMFMCVSIFGFASVTRFGRGNRYPMITYDPIAYYPARQYFAAKMVHLLTNRMHLAYHTRRPFGNPMFEYRMFFASHTRCTLREPNVSGLSMGFVLKNIRIAVPTNIVSQSVTGIFRSIEVDSKAGYVQPSCTCFISLTRAVP